MNKNNASNAKFGPLHEHDARVRNVPGAWHNRTSEVVRKIHKKRLGHREGIRDWRLGRWC